MTIQENNIEEFDNEQILTERYYYENEDELSQISLFISITIFMVGFCFFGCWGFGLFFVGSENKYARCFGWLSVSCFILVVLTIFGYFLMTS